jgi:hypothetical protein
MARRFAADSEPPRLGSLSGERTGFRGFGARRAKATLDLRLKHAQRADVATDANGSYRPITDAAIDGRTTYSEPFCNL